VLLAHLPYIKILDDILVGNFDLPVQPAKSRATPSKGNIHTLSLYNPYPGGLTLDAETKQVSAGDLDP
jgi:hypothetical protein